jgi:hypothetical protein
MHSSDDPQDRAQKTGTLAISGKQTSVALTYGTAIFKVSTGRILPTFTWRISLTSGTHRLVWYRGPSAMARCWSSQIPTGLNSYKRTREKQNKQIFLIHAC